MQCEFNTESEMTAFVVAIAHQLVGNTWGNVYVFTECPARVGVADIVFATIDHSVAAARVKSGLMPVTSAADAQLLSALGQGRPLDLRSLATATAYTLDYVRSRVASLVHEGYVGCLDGEYLLHPDFAPVIPAMIAVELKRDHWARGLYQARRYLRFADASYLALDYSYSHRVVPHLGDLARYSPDVGVLFVDACANEVILAHAPTISKSSTRADHLLVGERLWATELKGMQSPDDNANGYDASSKQLNPYIQVAWRVLSDETQGPG